MKYFKLLVLIILFFSCVVYGDNGSFLVSNELPLLGASSVTYTFRASKNFVAYNDNIVDKVACYVLDPSVSNPTVSWYATSDEAGSNKIDWVTVAPSEDTLSCTFQVNEAGHTGEKFYAYAKLKGVAKKAYVFVVDEIYDSLTVGVGETASFVYYNENITESNLSNFTIDYKSDKIIECDKEYLGNNETKFTVTGLLEEDYAGFHIWNTQIATINEYVNVKVGDSSNVSVDGVEITSDTHTISDNIITAQVGDYVTLKGNITPSNATNKNMTWSKSDSWNWNNATFTTYNENVYIHCKNVVTADDNYLVTVTSEDGAKTATVKLVVEPKPIGGIKLFVGQTELESDANGYKISRDVGTWEQIVAVVYDSQGNEYNDAFFNKVTWNNNTQAWNVAAKKCLGNNCWVNFKNVGEGAYIIVTSRVNPNVSVRCDFSTTLNFTDFTFSPEIATVKKGETIAVEILDTPLDSYRVSSLPMTLWSQCRPITDGKKVYFTGKKVGEYEVPVSVVISGISVTKNIQVKVVE